MIASLLMKYCGPVGFRITNHDKVLLDAPVDLHRDAQHHHVIVVAIEVDKVINAPLETSRFALYDAKSGNTILEGDLSGWRSTTLWGTDNGPFEKYVTAMPGDRFDLRLELRVTSV